MNKKVFAIIFIFALVSSAEFFHFIPNATANPNNSTPSLAMPVEYINYTISKVDGSLWAKIDGNYPIYLQNTLDCGFDGDLPMLYPMPSGTTNIHVTLNNTELSWTNYTQSSPEALHHTAIGDWRMIYSLLENVSGFIDLRIHYEHPLEMVNGSYLFLYDLNISPYLSPENNNSTAYFTVRIETNSTNLNAYTTETDAKWNPIEYSTKKEGSTTVVTIQMHSEYNKPLLGDLVVVFSDADQIPEFSGWIIPVLILLLLSCLLLYVKKKNFFVLS
jgi:hypothetical protein